MKQVFGILLTTATVAVSAQAMAQATLHANDGFTSQSLRTTTQTPRLQRQNFNGRASSAVVVGNRYAPLPGNAPAAVHITFFDEERFQGRSYTATGQVPNLRRTGFNEHASSVVVSGEPWEVCDTNRYKGQCMVLRPGRYPSLAAMGLSSEITSLRMLPRNTHVADNRYAPSPLPANDGRLRGGESLFEADTTPPRAVLLTSDRR